MLDDQYDDNNDGSEHEALEEPFDMLADSASTMSYSDHMHYCSVIIVYFVKRKGLVYMMRSLNFLI